MSISLVLDLWPFVWCLFPNESSFKTVETFLLGAEHIYINIVPRAFNLYLYGKEQPSPEQNLRLVKADGCNWKHIIESEYEFSHAEFGTQ